jgi:hypothetical protein
MTVVVLDCGVQIPRYRSNLSEFLGATCPCIYGLHVRVWYGEQVHSDHRPIALNRRGSSDGDSDHIAIIASICMLTCNENDRVFVRGCSDVYTATLGTK